MQQGDVIWKALRDTEAIFTVHEEDFSWLEGQKLDNISSVIIFNVVCFTDHSGKMRSETFESYCATGVERGSLCRRMTWKCYNA